MNLNSILIGSEDPATLVEYYRKLFGAPAMDEGGYTVFRVGNGAFVIGAHDEVKGKNAVPGRLIWNVESEDVRGDFERFKAAGAIVIQEPYGMEESAEGALIATFADPDGNYFQLMTPMPLQQ